MEDTVGRETGEEGKEREKERRGKRKEGREGEGGGRKGEKEERRKGEKLLKFLMTMCTPGVVCDIRNRCLLSFLFWFVEKSNASCKQFHRHKQSQ